MCNKCLVEWCNGSPNPSGKGYCRKHYDQLRMFGRILDKRTVADPSRVELFPDHAEIIITNSHDVEIARAMIDIGDVSKVSSYRWTLNGNGYVRTFEYGSTIPVYLHRMLNMPEKNQDVDHINRNRLDCRRNNMRNVTHMENCQNRLKKGSVHRVAGRNLAKPFSARITVNGRLYWLGYYATEADAQLAIDNFQTTTHIRD